MELVSFDVPWSRNKPVTIIPIGDIQWAGNHKSTSLTLLKETIAKGIDADAYFIGMGDYIDFMSPSNRQRLTGAALYDTATDVIDDKAMSLVLDIYEKALKPTKGRWLGCVPLDTEILTRFGWKLYNELIIGEEVLGYDEASDTCKWTRLTGIVEHPNEPLIRLESKSFHAISTPDHRWYVTEQARRGNDGNPHVETTETLNSHHRIKIAAVAESGSHAMTPREAAILGWLITDGTIYWGGSAASGAQGFIYQTKPDKVAQLRELLGNDATEREDARNETPSPDEGRLVYRTQPNTRFYLKQSLLRPLLEMADIRGPGFNLLPLITRLSQPARAAMLDAMMAAEGTDNMFSQNRGPVLEAFLVLAAMEGYRTGRQTPHGEGTNILVSLLKARPVAGVADMVITEQPSAAVWCPQTELGSWVMRQDGQITITGNCLEGHHFTQLKSGVTTDQKLCELLDATFLGTSAYIRLCHTSASHHMATTTIWCTHGHGGGGKSHSPILKLENAAAYWEADLMLVGHMSKMPATPINRIYPVFPGKGKPHLLEKTIYLLGTGGFSKGYVEGSIQGITPRGGYCEQKMLNPVALGAPTIRITVERTRIPGKRNHWLPVTSKISVEV